MAMADSLSHDRLIDHSNDPDSMSKAYCTDVQLILIWTMYVELPALYDCHWYCLFQVCLFTLSEHVHSAPLFWASFMHGSLLKHSVQVCSSVLGILWVFSQSWVSYHSACETTMRRRERWSQPPWVELWLHESQISRSKHSLWHFWHQLQESECQWFSTITCIQYIHSYKPPKLI